MRVHLRVDLSQLLLEAHVQHAVRLVHHQHRRAAEVHRAVLQEINDAPGRPDDDVGAASQLLPLVQPSRAAIEAHGVQVHALREAFELAVDLLREFASGRDHQHARARPTCALFFLRFLLILIVFSIFTIFRVMLLF